MQWIKSGGERDGLDKLAFDLATDDTFSRAPVRVRPSMPPSWPTVEIFDWTRINRLDHILKLPRRPLGPSLPASSEKLCEHRKRQPGRKTQLEGQLHHLQRDSELHATQTKRTSEHQLHPVDPLRQRATRSIAGVPPGLAPLAQD